MDIEQVKKITREAAYDNFLANGLNNTDMFTLIFRENGEVGVAPIAGVPTKEMYMELVKILMAKLGDVEYYSIVSEAFMAKVDPSDPVAAKLQTGEMAVSDLPADKRMDTLNFAIVNNEGCVFFESNEVKKTSLGFELEHIDMGDTSGMSGRLTELLQ